MTAGRTLRALPTLWRIGVAETLAYRAEFLVWVLTTTQPLIMLGLWLAVTKRRWRLGVVTALGAFALLVVDTRWLIPYFRGEPYPHLGRYAHLGRSVPEIITTLVLHPWRVLAGLLTEKRLVYLGALLAPLVFLPLLAPEVLLGLAPPLVENLLGQDPILFDHRTQYQSFILPFLFAAAIAGYDRLALRRPGPWRKTVLVVAVMASLVLSARTVNNLSYERVVPKLEHRQAFEVIAQVPADAVVSAQDPYVPHLALRPLVFVFPVGIEKADHLLLNTSTYPWRKDPDVIMKREGDTVTITKGVDGPTYRYAVAAERGPILLLRRR